MPDHQVVSVSVFALTVAVAFCLSLYARINKKNRGTAELSEQHLNRWLVGLSAGASANSGFIVTAAVGLGYTYGLHWVMLPIAWLLGDLVYWSVFPGKINALGRKTKASTVATLIAGTENSRAAVLLRSMVGAIVIVCLGFYLSSQWLAGQKFIAGSLQLPPLAALPIFAVIIIGYTAIGGFRGSVLTDSYQAILRLLATTVAIAVILHSALSDWRTVLIEMNKTPGFLQLFPNSDVVTIVCFMLGFSAAAFGFGLGQPQVLTRYMAAQSPREAQSAKWIYIFFVQYTWIGMSIFGVILRGVMPGLKDGETGLATFFSVEMPSVITGIIVADIFATIAATSNSLIIAMAQSVCFDFKRSARAVPRQDLLVPALILGVASMAISTLIHGSVVTFALSSVSIMGAGVAPAMIIRLLGWRCNLVSLSSAVVVGLVVAIAWTLSGAGAVLNEAAPGILAGICANAAVVRLFYRANQPSDIGERGDVRRD